MWLKLRTSNDNVLFLNASYVPPSSGKVYINCLSRYIIEEAEKIQNSFPKAVVFIAGDFNKMCLDDIEFNCCVNTLASPPTREDAWLDLVLTNRPNHIEKVDCFIPRVETDHKAVLVFPVKKNIPDRFVRTFRLFTARGHSDFSSLLKNADFSDVYCSDVDSAAEKLEDRLQKLLHESFPLRRVMMSTRDPAWLTPKMKWLLLKKKQAKRRGQNLKMTRIDLRLKDAKLRTLSTCGNKDWWRKIDRLTHRKHGEKSIDYHSFKPEDLNSHLAQRCNLAENELRRHPPDFDISKNARFLITLDEVCNALQSCKRTSSGPSGIPDFIFREHWQTLAPLYLHVWNLSLSQGVFPRCYKRADVHPLPKVRTAKHASQIRGISVTSIAARVFERVVHKKWMSDNILQRSDPLQFAYKKGMSTVDYLLFFQLFTLSHLDKKSTIGVHVVAVDFSRAFDSVDQELAAEGYPKFLDSPLLSKWLYDFTVNRAQRLIWKNTPCSFLTIDRGCSQGTVGGPAIFSILTDNIVPSSQECKIVKYSDDMSCIIPCLRDPSDLEKKMVQAEFANFCHQANCKNLKLNKEKTKQIRFCLHPTSVSQCSCDPIDISCVTHLKILGMTFQCNGLFTKHVDNLLSQARSLLYLLKDLHRHHVPLHELDRLFDAVILSRIRYGISVYACDNRGLKRIQNFLEKCYMKHYIMKRIDIENLVKCEDQKLLEKILNNTRHPLRAYLLSNQKSRTTRHNFLGVKPRTNTKLFLRSFCHRVLTY